jgi:hypothetical protein
MPKNPPNTPRITALRRGQIVQRVLVDEWSPAQAAAAFGVAERQVVRWLAAYRRHGMASLRGDVAVETKLQRWLSRIQLGFVQFVFGLPGDLKKIDAARCVPLRRRGEPGPHPAARDGGGPGSESATAP